MEFYMEFPLCLAGAERQQRGTWLEACILGQQDQQPPEGCRQEQVRKHLKQRHLDQQWRKDSAPLIRDHLHLALQDRL